MDNAMRAYFIQKGEKSAVLTNMPEQPLAENQIRVSIKACGLNFADLLMIKGTYQDTPERPFTLGMELSGVVTESQAAAFSVGDRVAVFSGQGGLAESGVFNADRAIHMPDGMSFEQGAAFQIAYGTSHVALQHRANMQAGETLLVLGAAGGVGLTAVEIGKRMGARVIACARGTEKLQIAQGVGADELVDSDTENLRDVFKSLGGADVVYDAVGGDLFQAAFRACNPEARLLPIGFASGDVPQIPANHLLVKNLTVIGFYWGGYMKFRPDIIRDSLKTLSGWIAEGSLKPHISHVLPLTEVETGLELLRSRKATGKVVITP